MTHWSESHSRLLVRVGGGGGVSSKAGEADKRRQLRHTYQQNRMGNWFASHNF